MTVEEARRLHPDLRRHRKYDGLGVGPVRYVWDREGESRTENGIVVDAEGGTARIVSYSIDRTGDASGLDRIRSRLEEIWGRPTEPEGLERLLVVGKWTDSACNVEAHLRTIGPIRGEDGPPRIAIVITNRAAMNAHKKREEEQRLQRAREAEW